MAGVLIWKQTVAATSIPWTQVAASTDRVFVVGL